MTTSSADPTAIVTYARGWPALAAVRSLGRRGVRVVAGDSVACAPATFSRYCAASFRYPDPSAEPEAFLDRLEAVVREQQQATGGEVVLLPVHAETYLIAAHRERFEAIGARLALPSTEQIEQTRDKGRLADLARDLGIRIPLTRAYEDVADVYRDAPHLTYPVFVKVRGAAAGVGIEKVDGPQALIEAYERFVDGYELSPAEYPLVQEAVPGDDYCVSALFDRGRCVALHTYRNVRQFPRTTGAGVLRETVAAPEAEGVARRLLEHLGWHGIAQLDFRWDEGADGTAVEPSLIELNPRLFGGLPQAVAAGVDYPWMLFQLALGHTPQPPTVDPTVRTETPVLGLIASLQAVGAEAEPGAALVRLREAVQAREHGEALWPRVQRLLAELGRTADPRPLVERLSGALALHRGTINDVFRTDDPLPVLGVLYPLTVALKHGSLSTAVVLSEARMKTRAVRQGLATHLQPSWRILLLTAVVFLVSVLATHWGPVQSSVVGAAFELPARWASALAPAWQGTPRGYAVFHLVNFVFLYLLAGLGLRLREAVHASRAEALRA